MIEFGIEHDLLENTNYKVTTIFYSIFLFQKTQITIFTLIGPANKNHKNKFKIKNNSYFHCTLIDCINSISARHNGQRDTGQAFGRIHRWQVQTWPHGRKTMLDCKKVKRIKLLMFLIFFKLKKMKI